MKWDDVFIYDCNTGKLLWKHSKGGWVKRGVEAGGLNKSQGYRRVRVNGVLIDVHRIVWDMNYPDDTLKPGEEIDHINHVRDDNRLSNLRKVSRSVNMKNKSLNKNNASGAHDVYFDKRRNKWHVRITVNWVRKHVGYFESLEDATAARKLAERGFGFHQNHGAKLCD
ncbi:HNH endonuclease [Salmonella enterica subsp. enterica serovar Kentucky]|nr:HNH endonuclease [Salmonella enterica subsp. enterica serovar Kentucky]EJO6831361.1 HNH endonuclease [Salmonella enterica]EKP1882985.1 HNH endonuclease [Salmonella enterica subsp. enterica serovar Kentucky]EKZ7384643.1 HNH endonuclease [Salmonella enterica subsp. enterica serovar Kentucky]ELH4999597.1 HNH endonuclease [Salmonella enterica subsp. enterica serovar Kentucky]